MPNETITIFVKAENLASQDAYLFYRCIRGACGGSKRYMSLAPGYVKSVEPSCYSCDLPMKYIGLTVDVEVHTSINVIGHDEVGRASGDFVGFVNTGMRAQDVIDNMPTPFLHDNFRFNADRPNSSGVRVTFEGADDWYIHFDATFDGVHQPSMGHSPVVNAFLKGFYGDEGLEGLYTAAAPYIKRERPLVEESVAVAQWIMKVLTCDVIEDDINKAVEATNLEATFNAPPVTPRSPQQGAISNV
jgi:hypothetical protein